MHTEATAERVNAFLEQVHGFRVWVDGGWGAFDLGDGREWPFPPSAFRGEGLIAGRPVACRSPEAQVQCHGQGYVPRDKDIQDMLALQARFELVLPLALGTRVRRDGGER